MAEAAAAAGVVATTVKDLPVVFPDIKLDGRRTYSGCTVTSDGRTLTNQDHPFAPSQTETFSFLGTCGTEPLPDQQTCYWQVRLEAVPEPGIVRGESLCEAGVAVMEAMKACGLHVALTQHPAMTVRLVPREDNMRAVVFQSCRAVASEDLTWFNARRVVRRTLGFLLNVPKKTLAILDIPSKQVICQREVDLSQPLWPCVSVVHTARHTQAAVTLTVDSGEHLTLTPPILELLRQLLKESDD